MVLTSAVPVALGVVLAVRLPRHPAGWLLVLAGITLAVVIQPGDLAEGPFAGLWMLLYLPLALLLLVLPTGRLPSRRWLVVAVGLPLDVALFAAAVATQWAFPEFSAIATVVSLVFLAAFMALLVASAVSLVTRYRRASERERLQLRWLYLAGMTVPITLLLCWVSYLVFQTQDLVVIGLILMYVAIPAATAVAILRPTWFDVDRVTVASVSIGALAIGVLAAVTAGSMLAGLALVAISPTGAVVVAVALTLVAALTYRFTRRTVGRIIYPERERALRAIAALKARVESGADLPERLQDVLRTALRDPGLAVGYRRIADRALVGLDNELLDARTLATTVRLNGDDIGVLACSSSRVKPVADEVASQASALVQAIRMRSELATALQETAASRERIVRAGFEERQRLERDLHDGAQQRLVALGMALRVLQRSRPRGDTVADSLDRAVAQLGIAVAELRQIAHGVRPSALDDGLGPALANLVLMLPTTVHLDIHAGELSDAIGTTAYFVASEAMTNAVKHADADTIRVEITREADDLRVRVSDDGQGGAVLRPAAGLAGLQDRVAAMGGSFYLDSVAGRGTTVEALLPCA